MSFARIVKHERDRAQRAGASIGLIEARRRAANVMLDGFADVGEAADYAQGLEANQELYTPDGIAFTVADLRYAIRVLCHEEPQS